MHNFSSVSEKSVPFHNFFLSFLTAIKIVGGPSLFSVKINCKAHAHKYAFQEVEVENVGVVQNDVEDMLIAVEWAWVQIPQESVFVVEQGVPSLNYSEILGSNPVDAVEFAVVFVDYFLIVELYIVDVWTFSSQIHNYWSQGSTDHYRIFC